MPHVERDWRIWAGRVICPLCIYYDECMMEHDCKALEIIVKIYENLDCGNPDE